MKRIISPKFNRAAVFNGHNGELVSKTFSFNLYDSILNRKICPGSTLENNSNQFRKHSTMSMDDNRTYTPSQESTGNSKRPIYVAATHQHVGKTTTCLALISGLQKRFPKSIGYLKPVGQQHVPVYSEAAGSDIKVDKDVSLIREKFQLHHLDYRDMSPVIIPRGYTKDYIDGKISLNGQLDLIKNAYDNISNENEVVLCEGTGHCAVGSIVGASNAKVASMLGADMVLIANGGLGKKINCLILHFHL